MPNKKHVIMDIMIIGFGTSSNLEANDSASRVTSHNIIFSNFMQKGKNRLFSQSLRCIKLVHSNCFIFILASFYPGPHFIRGLTLEYYFIPRGMLAYLC